MPEIETVEPPTEAVDFFYRWGYTSWNPDTETEDEGKRRGARETAIAEAWGKAKGLVVVWVDDWSVDHKEEFPDAYPVNGPNTCEEAYIEYKGEVVAALGCIDDADENYRRVTEANLMEEAHDEVERLDRTVKIEATFVLTPYDLKRFGVSEPTTWDWRGFLELADESTVEVRKVD